MWMLTKDEMKQTIQVVTSSYHREWMPHLLEGLERSRDPTIAMHPDLLLKLQYELALTLSQVECKLTQLKQNREQKLADLAGLPRDSLGESVQEEIDYLDTSLAIFRHVAKEIRCIGDGIAWRTVDFDRPVLRVLAENKSPGYLDVSSAGFQSELAKSIEILRQRGSTVLLNAITNFLRIGDLIEIENGSYSIIEVKSSRRFSRGRRFQRQIARMNQACEILETGIIDTGEKQIRINYLDVAPQNYLARLSQLIDQAHQQGFAMTTFGEFLTVSCTDVHQVGTRNMEEVEGWQEAVSQPSSEGKEDPIMFLSNYDTFKRTGGEFPRNVAPYSIFPFPPQTCIELISGKLLLVSKLRLQGLINLFTEHNWEVQRPDWKAIVQFDKAQAQRGYSGRICEHALNETLLTIARGPFHIDIPSTWLLRIGFEFLSPDVLIELVEKMYQGNVPGIEENVIVALAREREMWI